jgi:hypothetical protein
MNIMPFGNIIAHKAKQAICESHPGGQAAPISFAPNAAYIGLPVTTQILCIPEE